jgi:hypothetical protein
MSSEPLDGDNTIEVVGEKINTMVAIHNTIDRAIDNLERARSGQAEELVGNGRIVSRSCRSSAELSSRSMALQMQNQNSGICSIDLSIGNLI